MNGCHNPHGETTEREPVTFTDDLSPKQRTVVRCTNVASNKRVMFPYTHSTHRKGSMRKYSAKGTYQNEGKRGEAIPESKTENRWTQVHTKFTKGTRPDPTGPDRTDFPDPQTNTVCPTSSLLPLRFLTQNLSIQLPTSLHVYAYMSIYWKAKHTNSTRSNKIQKQKGQFSSQMLLR